MRSDAFHDVTATLDDSSYPPHLPATSGVAAPITSGRLGQRGGSPLIAVAVAVLLAAMATGSFGFQTARGEHSMAGGGRGRSGVSSSEALTRLERPSALVLGLHSVLYIADDERNQILKRLPNGTFRIVAGTGKAGFSGDGGPAPGAKLNMPLGMAVGGDGTLYFADEGNNRIRAVAPDGTIATIAGNGRSGWVRSGTPARAAAILSPTAVTLGPAGQLYVADAGDNEVLRLEKNGTVTAIAGNRHYAGVYGIGGPASRASPDGPSGLAFDRLGNLYLAGFNTKTLLMVTPRGIMTLPAGTNGFYPRGKGDLVTAPDGSVYAANTLTIVRLTPHGIVPILDFSRMRFDGITGFLPQGVAVAPNGDIYTDTWYGNGYANKTALIVVRPGGKPRVLWKG